MTYEVEHYATPDNKERTNVVDLMYAHNDEFAATEASLVEQTNVYLTADDETLSGRAAIERYYDELCDELVVVKDDDNTVVACRFVEYDEEDEYFRTRVENYEIGLNLTFALVHRDHRREGLWSMMLAYVEEHIFPKYDVDRLYLATATTNTTMQAAAEGAGFDCINTVPNDRGDSIGTHVYMKQQR